MAFAVRRWCSIVALAMLSACDSYSCRWSDEPPPRYQSHQPDRAYRTDDGVFELILRADDRWPLAVGTASVGIEARLLVSDGDGPPQLRVATPYTRDDELVAETDPRVVELEAGRWRIEGLVFDAPGPWVVPLEFRQGAIGDTMELDLEVAEAN